MDMLRGIRQGLTYGLSHKNKDVEKKLKMIQDEITNRNRSWTKIKI